MICYVRWQVSGVASVVLLSSGIILIVACVLPGSHFIGCGWYAIGMEMLDENVIEACDDGSMFEAHICQQKHVQLVSSVALSNVSAKIPESCSRHPGYRPMAWWGSS